MDYGFTNDQHQLAIHTLDADEVEKLCKKLPQDSNPWDKYYEETELDAMRHYLITGGPLVHEIPPDFGVLSHPNPTNGKSYLRYLKGIDHGMARPEDGGRYEAAKSNQRLNPRIDRVGNYKVDRSDAVRSEHDMKAGILAHFPNIGGLVTSAPYKSSEIGFAKEQKVQESCFFTKFWNHSEMRMQLLEQLFGFSESLSMLTRSCQTIRQGVEEQFGYFATNSLNFHNCDKSPAELKALVASGKLTQQDVDNIRVPKFLIIGPVRYSIEIAPGFEGDHTKFWPPQVWPAGEEEPQPYENLFEKSGFRKTVGYTYKRKDTNHFRNCIALQKTLKAFYHHRRNFHFVAISHLDLMNTDTIEAIIEDLANLECLSIWGCPLVDLSQVLAVIKIVRRVNDARKAANERLMDLDIAPQFRQGPIIGRKGSYGITHSDPMLYQDWGTDIGRALTASLVSLLREADLAGIQLCQPGKGFRNWLDKLPLYVNQTFNLCVTAANFLENEKTREAYSQEVYPSSKDEVSRAALVKRFDETVALDLVIAAEARPVGLQEFKKQGMFRCTTCNETLPGHFFRPESQCRVISRITCEGCELNFQLEYERGNSHIQRVLLANFIWRGAPEMSLSWVVGGSKAAERNWKRLGFQARKLPTNDQLLEEVQGLCEQRQDMILQLREMCNWSDKKDLLKKMETIGAEIELLKIRAGCQRAPKTCLATMYDWDYRRRAYNWRGEVERGDHKSEGPYENLAILTLEKHFTMLN